MVYEWTYIENTPSVANKSMHNIVNKFDRCDTTVQSGSTHKCIKKNWILLRWEGVKIWRVDVNYEEDMRWQKEEAESNRGGLKLFELVLSWVWQKQRYSLEDRVVVN